MNCAHLRSSVDFRSFTAIATATVVALLLTTSPTKAADDADKLAKSAAARTAPELLPASTALYAEVSRPKQSVDMLLAHPLREKLEALDAYRAFVLSKQYLQFNFGLTIAETALGMKWDAAVEALAGGGIHAAFDAEHQTALALLKATDAQKLVTTRDKFFEIVRADAKKKNQPDPVQSADYKGCPIYTMGKACLATVGPWLLLSNQSAGIERMIDRIAAEGDSSGEKTPNSLAAQIDFQSARTSLASENGKSRTAPLLWAYVAIKPLRDAGALSKILADKSDQPAAEALVGGLQSNLAKTPYIAARLNLDDKSLRLTVTTPHDSAWVPKPREFYFGPQGKGRAPAPLTVPNMALSLTTHRDLAALWLDAADLFTEKANADLSQAESNLSNLFGGKSFSRDILASLEPDWQLLLARQDFSKSGMPVPQIKLPAGALVFRMKEPEKMQRQLKVSFQSIVGFLNIVGGMNGLPQLDMNTEKQGKNVIVSAEYMMDESIKPAAGKLHYNFSPSVAIVGDRFIVASTKSIAESLAEAAAKTPSGAPSAKAASNINTALTVNAAEAGRMLDDNRAQLVAQNMLEKGNDKAKAEADIKVFTDIIAWFDHAGLQLRTPSGKLELELAVRFAGTPSAK